MPSVITPRAPISIKKLSNVSRSAKFVKDGVAIVMLLSKFAIGM
jgi:hypothetical protein